MSNQLFPLHRTAWYERGCFFLPPNDNVVVLGTVRGHFSSHELEEAVRKLQLKHPLMNAHAEIREDGTGWLVAKALATIPVKRAARVDENSWKEIVSNEFSKPFNVMEAPLIRILWLHQRDLSDIVLFCHHAICDGRSLTGLLHDLLNYLGNKVPVERVEPIPPIDQVFPLERVRIGRFRELAYSRLRKSWSRAGIRVSPRDFKQIQRDFSTRRVRIYTWSIDPQMTARIIERCHEENVSVNSCLFAALLSVEQSFHGDSRSPKLSAMAVDLRGYCDPPLGSGLGLYASIVTFKYRVKVKAPFSRQVADLQRYLDKKTTPNQVLRHVKLSQWLGPPSLDNWRMLFFGLQIENPPEIFHRMIAELKKSTLLSLILKTYVKEAKKSILGAAITNLGKIPLDTRYGNLTLQNVVFCPPPTPQVERTIGVSSFSSGIQHSIVAYDMDQDKTKAFVEMYRTQLEQF